jgi:multiple antibiotic resistance protein
LFDVAAHLGPARFVAVLPLFRSTFATLLAIINPLEVLAIFLSLTHDKDQTARRHIV